MSTTINLEFTGTKRFLVRRRLGAGGFGVVYHVYDQERQSEVALKLLHKTEANALYQFKKEFRTLADITHPNLVTLYELLSEKDYWFFTMELVPGVSFLEYVRGLNANVDNPRTERVGINTLSTKIDNRSTQDRENFSSKPILPKPSELTKQPLNIDRLRLALKQLAEGVSALHKIGKLHCDLKPSNVLVTNENRLVLLDFGLVTELTANIQDREVFGTPDYMSPEHGVGKPLSEASDWYSLGVMLYEALTGQLPFDSTFGNVIKEKLLNDALPPNKLAKDIPIDLDILCQKLLKRNPKERPSKQEIFEQLGIKTKTQDHNIITLGSSVTPLVGRENHLKALQSAFDLSKTGQVAIRYVSGFSGMGKTALTRHFLHLLKKDNPETVILSGRCYEQESVPYKAFDSIIDNLSQYLKSLPPATAEKLIPEDILAITRLFPVLLQVDIITSVTRKAIDIPSFQELRLYAFTALRELFSRLSKEKPLVLFIDDLQWGDLDSIALLEELTCPPNPPSMLLIATYRSEEVTTSPVLKALQQWQKNNSLVNIEEISITHLSVSETTELIATLSDTYQNISPSQTEMIIRESGGNPFFIDELIRYLQMDSTNLIEKSVEITLEEVILARAAQLPKSAQDLLKVLALAGQPLRRNIAKQAAKLEKEEQTALAFLRSNHLVRVREKQQEVEIYHDRIRETVVKNLPQKDRQQLHNDLAISLEQNQEKDSEALAMHFLGAGNKLKAAHYTLQAADQAAKALAFDHAAGLYRQVLDLENILDKAQLASLKINLGNALVNSGCNGEAAKSYLEAANLVNQEQALELKQKAAEQFMFGGHIDQGLAILNSVLQSIGMKLAGGAKRALLSLLLRRLQLRLRGLKFRPRLESEIPRLELFKIDTCLSIASGLSTIDTIRGADFQARHVLLALAAGEPYRVARAITMEAGFSSIAGTKSKARTQMLFEKAEELIKQLQNKQVEAALLLNKGLATFLSGQWQESYQNMQKAISIFSQHCTGVNSQINTCQLFALRALLYLGKLNKLSEELPAIFKQANERGNLWAITGLGTAVCYMPYIVSDEPEQAKKQIQTAIEKWSRDGYHLQHYWALLGRAQIEIYLGQGKTALELMNAQWPSLEKELLLEVQNSVVEMYHLRARSALACLKSNTENSKKLLAIAEKDAKVLLREKVATGDAFAKLIQAAIAFNRNQKATAIELLKLAREEFEKIDMALYKAATEHRLGQLLANDEGKNLIELAKNWMQSQKIKNFDRMTEMLIPGFY